MLFILALSTVIYLPALFNDLVWDADLLFRYDPRLRDIRHAFDYFHQGIWGFDTNRAVDYYRPLIGLLHNIEYQLFGLNAVGYNVINLLLNAGVCLLAYKLLQRFMGEEAAFLGAMIYATLPIRAEVVYWTYSDSHLLVAVFILLATIYYYDENVALAITFLILALLAQEIAVVVPAIFVAVSIYKKTARKDIRSLLISFILVAAYFFIRSIVLGSGFIKNIVAEKDYELVFYFFSKYFKILFVQDAPITIYARTPRSLDDFTLFFWAGVGLLIVTLMALVYFFSKKHPNFFWLVWFILLILPVFFISKSGVYYIAEKGLFLSSLGIVAILISIRLPYKLMMTVIAIVITVNSYSTFAEGKYWKDTETYLEKALEFDGNFILGMAALGDAYFAKGDYDQALKHYRRIITLNPWHLGAIRSIREIERIKSTLPQAN